jgi:bacterial/archaeal transporter family protein
LDKFDKRTFMWILYALLAALFAGLTAVFAKAGLKNINADLATAFRTVIIMAIAWGFVIFTGKLKAFENFTKANWLFLILSGVATGLSWLFYNRALQEGNTVAVNALDKVSVLVIVVLSFFFLKEPLTVKILVGALLIVAGSLLVTWQ